MARFTVQAALAEMRAEQREDHQTLTTKVDEGFKHVAEVMAAHTLEDAKQFGAIDSRLKIVETTRRTVRWLGATAIVAILSALADYLLNHFGHVKP